MPYFDRADADVQNGRDVVVPQSFQITQHQHFAVVGRQPVQSGPHTAPQFLAQQALARPAAKIDQTIGQLHSRLDGQGQHARFLAFDAAAARAEMAAVQLDQPLPGQPPQPRIEGQRPLPQVVVELAGGVGEGFLHHVGRVHAGRQASIQMGGDHATQSAAVTGQQPLPRLVVALPCLFQQVIGTCFRGHGGKTSPID